MCKNCLDEGSACGGVLLGGSGSIGEDFEDLVEASKFDAGFNHAGAAGETEAATGVLHAGVTTNDGADGGAVDVGDLSEIEDDEIAFRADDLFDFLFDTAAIRAGMNAALHVDDGDAGFGRGFIEQQDHGDGSPSYGNWRIRRIQSPSALKSVLPQPQGTKGAVF